MQSSERTSCPRANSKSELLRRKPVLLVLGPGGTPGSVALAEWGRGRDPGPVISRNVGGWQVWLSTPAGRGDLPELACNPDPGGSPMSASSFLTLRGHWGKAGGCETELSPNPPGGNGETRQLEEATQLEAEKQLLGLPSAPPFLPSPAITLESEVSGH